MSAPLVPSPLDYIGLRRFAFYPPIKNFEPNEWLLGTGSWTDVQVVNSSTGSEMWIPRQYIGAVSESNEPLLVVGLTKELEYRAGNLEPRVKCVIEMPQTTSKFPKRRFKKKRRRAGPAPVIGIRVEDCADSSNKALAALGIALIISLVAALILCTRYAIVN
jgi:hypothetical protein